MLSIPVTVETIRWSNGYVEMIDQRILPDQFIYRSYDSAAGIAESIQSMVIRGAPAIGVAAAYGVALEAIRQKNNSSEEFDFNMNLGFKILSESRPTAVNLFWALDRMRKFMVQNLHATQPVLAELLLNEAHNIFNEDIAANKRIGDHGASLLSNGDRVLTHCNAGALATAGYGTALGIFRSAKAAGKNISVIADETRPFLQGARLTAWEMLQEGIPVTLITDNMSGYLMSCGEIDAVVVGADRVAANGDVVNKIGTYMVAVLAKRHNIPFYVACPLSTIDLSISSGVDIKIEERSPEEVMGFRDIKWAPDGVMVRNPAFDITPSNLVTALITEKGVINTKEISFELMLN